ncbi:SDR family oxidoreductase [Pseudomaricurvus alkylphenolicus]|uniref:SDR family NAD(P)-dependent oxidoreductase n=1 Tax=Pseudomaricurvus alkylphenolicus TaxID=1306991 RepID=UPI001421BE17|nr:SDR family oxidoreductase [Pseudomaricurvus alkylphenolicus]NIB38383.1 SDR family oxidoreductase [Pseudomaricurvus alkylphenolicus]
MFDLQEKKAFITGGSSGIGLAVAKRYLKAGAEVVISDISDGSEIAASIGAAFIRADVGDEQNLSEALAQAESLLGKLDIVVNNAGVGDIGSMIEGTEQQMLEHITRINQWGVFYGLKHAPKHMNDGGSIINTSSMAAYICIPGTGAYTATKGAVLNLTRQSALELAARNIRVNAVCPGYIDTPMSGDAESYALAEAMTPLGRMGQVEDLVGAFHYLAADESSYYTGQIMQIDGGWTTGPTPRLMESIIGKTHTG